jgi:hypothetical protein
MRSSLSFPRAPPWIVGSLLLSWYVANFGTYNATYGSLGAVIGFMVWMWLSTIIVLVVGEINAEMEHQTAKDTTEGPRKPMGARGARMADEIGEAHAQVEPKRRCGVAPETSKEKYHGTEHLWRPVRPSI